MDNFIVETSARHCHLSEKDLCTLFGENYQLTKKKDLSQPGQFACEEKVTVVGEKGELKMSILGPTRSASQVEISLTDARSVGLNAPIRESGMLDDAGKCVIKGPKGEVELEHAVICALRHLHSTPKDAERLGIKNGDIIKVCVDSENRKLIFDDVVVRVSENYSLAMHIDTDESNACFGAKTGYIIK